MADISVTAASVATSRGTVNRGYNAGTAITAGQYVYLTGSPLKWQLAKADANTTLPKSDGTVLGGFALHASVNGQPLAVQTDGAIVLAAAAMPTGRACFVSAATAGAVADAVPAVAATNTDCMVGVFSSTTTLEMGYGPICPQVTAT